MSTVTVVIPVYNGERYVKEAVRSILDQTWSDFELLIIDDASTDRSMEIIGSLGDPRIKIVRHDTNMGIAAARNRGLELAVSKYIALLDQDDIALPYRLAEEVAYLEANPDVDVVGGHQRSIDSEGRDMDSQWSVYLNPAYISAYLMLNNTVVNGSAMFRKELVDTYHIRYRENQFGAEDYRFWVECSLHGTIKNIDKVFLLWRCGHGNTTDKMIREHREERRRTVSSIQRLALEGRGIYLSESELDVLSRVFFDDGCIDDEIQLRGVYQTLQSIAAQARENRLDNAGEIVTMCRKRFGEKVGKAFFLWKG